MKRLDQIDMIPLNDAFPDHSGSSTFVVVSASMFPSSLTPHQRKYLSASFTCRSFQIEKQQTDTSSTPTNKISHSCHHQQPPTSASKKKTHSHSPRKSPHPQTPLKITPPHNKHHANRPHHSPLQEIDPNSHRTPQSAHPPGPSDRSRA